MRIVSLLPSATEIVCALGARAELAARSHECDFPESVQRLPVVTAPKVRGDGNSQQIHESVAEVLRNDISVYRVDAELLRAIRPDVIVTQVQCDVCAVSLRDVEASVGEWTDGDAPRIVALNPSTLEDIFRDIESVASAIGRSPVDLIESMRSRIETIARRARTAHRRPRVATIEWISPLMTAGNWIPEMIDLAGGENLFGTRGQHSPWIDPETFVRADPEVVIVFPCGFSIERAIADMPLLELETNARVVIADGNQFFNRPGPRIVESLEILAEVLHPELFDFGRRPRGFVEFERSAGVSPAAVARLAPPPSVDGREARRLRPGRPLSK